MVRVRRRSRDVIAEGSLVKVAARAGSRVIVFPVSGQPLP
jgi:hypothetical protein